MYKQVEELVEWVADGISTAQCSACGGSGDVCERCPYPNSYDLAKQALSHPDIALIDRDDCVCNYLHYHQGEARMTPKKFYQFDKKFKPIIRLSEALKEDKEK